VSRVRIVLCFSIIVLAHALAAEKPAPRVEYLDNGTIKIGIDLSIGGSITYLADSKHLENIINSYDWGRQIQQSYYSGPVPFGSPAEAWKALGWNPVQSGDCYNNCSRVLEFRRESNLLYVKTVPMHWPLNNVPGECIMENWIELDRNTAKVRCRLSNNRSDRTQYPARSQELPALYTNGTFWRLMTYTGDKPFSNAPLERIPKREVGASFPWRNFLATECWAALVNDSDWGVGIVTPGTHAYLGGFAGKENTGREKDSPCGYIAPLQNEIIDHNIVYDYSYTLVVGTLNEIRGIAYSLRQKDSRPNYVFSQDRQHWTYANATDSGWPIQNKLRVSLEHPNPQLLSPACAYRAEDVPTLYMRAMTNGRLTGSRVYWKCHGDAAFDPARSMAFELTPGKSPHTIGIDLFKAATYKGTITGIRIDLASGSSKDQFVEIDYIGHKKPEERK